MNEKTGGFLRRGGAKQRGQALIFVTLSLTMLVGLAALLIDAGRLYIYSNALNASTQAAALAGAGAMSEPGATVSSASSAVTTYSSTTGSKNVLSGLSSISIASGYPAFSCLSTVTSVFGVQCTGPSGSNAIAVKQTATVPLFFMSLLGVKTATLTATATASMKGAYIPPYNVVIIVDSTQSMNDTDSDSLCNNTRLYCAMQGVQILLKGLSPCLPSESSCGTATGGMVANSYDRVRGALLRLKIMPPPSHPPRLTRSSISQATTALPTRLLR